jgi:hypothetical protein
MMKSLLLALFMGWVGCTTAQADEKKELDEIVVPNFDANGPACRVQFPVSAIKCSNESCDIPAPKRSSLKMIKISFSCIPNSANTGFERPPEDAKVYPIKASNANGNVMMIDQLIPGPAGRMRELLFCLYGKRSTFCGNADTMLLKDGEATDGSRSVINFVKTMILMDSDGDK